MRQSRYERRHGPRPAKPVRAVHVIPFGPTHFNVEVTDDNGDVHVVKRFPVANRRSNECIKAAMDAASNFAREMVNQNSNEYEFCGVKPRL